MADKSGKYTGSLSGKLFRSISVFTLIVLLFVSCVLITAFYLSYERDAENELVAQAQDAASYLNKAPSSEHISALREQFSGVIRYTLIAEDGTVLYDSFNNADSLENHGDRPEVAEALETGSATSTRYSETLRTVTDYAVILLDDGTIIRLAETRHSLISFFAVLALPIAIILVGAVLLVFFLSKVLTNRIMKPIDSLDFEKLLDNNIYEEMGPLLKRIDEQQTQLKKQNLELAQAENLRRDFSSNVSHEMKTPLQVISGYAELLQNDMVDPKDRRKAAGLIYDEAQAMRLLIDDVLTLSRLDESALEYDAKSVDVYALVLHVAQRIESFALIHEVSVEVEGESAFMAGNKTLIEEMLYNLIENGIRYNHPQGQVKVTIGTDTDEVVIKVTDTGPGMPEDMKDKIFERFFRIDKSRSKETGGTGLGLAIVKHAVLYHNGTIEVQTALDEGTTFIVRFPQYRMQKPEES